MCENAFLCYDKFTILGETIEGVGWFALMVFGALVLQIISNFVSLWRNQLTRETLEEARNSKTRKKDVLKSVLWSFIATLLWIIRVILIIGNNIWIFAAVLIGNVAGYYWALIRQRGDTRVVTPPSSNSDILSGPTKKNKLYNSRILF